MKQLELDLIQATLQLTTLTPTRAPDAERQQVRETMDIIKESLAGVRETLQLLDGPVNHGRASHNNSVVEPGTGKKSKLPRNLLKFHSDAKDSPLQFLRRLELVLETEGYPKGNWSQALAVQVTGTGTTWVVRELSHQADWELTREAFLAHFDHHDQKFIRRQRLNSLKQGTKEGVRQYSDKFGTLVEELDEDESSEQVLSLFYNGLKRELKPHYRIASLSNTPASLAEAFAMALAIESALDTQEEVKVERESGSLPLKPVFKGDRQVPIKKVSPSNKVVSSNSIPVCTFCRRRGHLEEEYYTKKNRSKPTQVPSITCFHC